MTLEKETSEKFSLLMLEGKDKNPAVAAVKTLIHLIHNYNGMTINGLMDDLRVSVKILERLPGKSRLAVSSAAAQFIRYTTLYLGTIESEDFSVVTKLMMEEGGKYLRRCEQSIKKIAKLGAPFIYDGARLLVEGDSRVVMETLNLIPENIYFTVFLVTDEGKIPEKLEKVNIECVPITHAQVATRMENIDLVLVGAEAVVKNGGIINRVGTYSIAICAREMNKPMYVFAESFKFSLLYPLNQADLHKMHRDDERSIRVDYTPPKYLTLLVTDRGLLTPVAVCDELIEMYT